MSLNSVLTTYGQIGVEVLKQAVAPHDATGKTQQSIRYVVEEKLIFIARNYFTLLEKGIKPSTKEPIPSREMIEFMTEYARARGMDNPEKAAWAISINQLKKGDKTHRDGGRLVYSDVMKTFSDDLKKSLTKDFGKSIIDNIKKTK
jgi:hypothetical protein